MILVLGITETVNIGAKILITIMINLLRKITLNSIVIISLYS